jgi:hypothetical protein
MIAFCITCKGRTQHLRETLPKNLADNPRSKFIVLDYNSGDGLLEYLRTEHGGEIQTGRLVVYSYPAANQFKMAHAKNMAHRLGILEGADLLCNLDADNFLGPRFEDYIERTFELASGEIVMQGTMIKGVLPRGINGRIVCTARNFIKAGGYDEKYQTWSPDDKDFNLRLRLLGCEVFEIELQYLDAVRHNDKMRFREYPHAQHKGGYYDVPRRHHIRSACVNSGNFGCGIVFRNWEFADSIALRPIPTRIFGIGYQKTATTSLHHALEILGYESAHWKSAHWAKAIWRDMTRQGYSNVLERSYAACDFPIALLYRQLDAAYPGSKFILTTRRNGEWLKSVEDHWNPAVNTFRAGWDSDPFSNRMHFLAYGRETFDAGVMASRYMAHNLEVLTYFRKRWFDFLHMDMSAGAGWPQLCHFLGCEQPKVEYPRAYAAY